MPVVLETTAKHRHRWRHALITVFAALAIALVVNAYVQDRQTRTAKADIGRIVNVPGGAMQIRVEGKGPPLVLLHGFAASMHWWSAVAVQLARTHKLIRIDLRGHGGSEKPRQGYSMEAQADAVAGVVKKIGVSEANVAGHSMGGVVATALAQRHPRLVKRIVIIGSPAGAGDGKLPLIGRLVYVPVLGELLKSVTPRAAVKSALKSAFEQSYEGKVPEQFVNDVKKMTYSSYDKSHSEAGDFLMAKSLPERLKGTHKQLLVIFGKGDQLVNPQALKKFKAGVPGASTRYVSGAGHTPMVEKPQQTARLILDFLNH